MSDEGPHAHWGNEIIKHKHSTGNIRQARRKVQMGFKKKKKEKSLKDYIYGKK